MPYDVLLPIFIFCRNVAPLFSSLRNTHLHSSLSHPSVTWHKVKNDVCPHVNCFYFFLVFCEIYVKSLLEIKSIKKRTSESEKSRREKMSKKVRLWNDRFWMGQCHLKIKLYDKCQWHRLSWVWLSLRKFSTYFYCNGTAMT